MPVSVNPSKPYIIAEIGANHNGDIELAKQLVDKAKECGCNAVKFQLWGKYTAHTKSYIKKLKRTRYIDSAPLSNPELGLKNVEEQLERFCFGHRQHEILKEYCDMVEIDFASTCLTEEDVDFLIELEVDFLKIASQDLDHPYFIQYIASKNYPTILSTGLGTLTEIETAVNCFIPDNIKNLILMHCVSLYPPEDKVVNLNMIQTLRNIFNVSVGYSDHTLGFSISLAAIAKGAIFIEKHFTLDKNMPGWDHAVSADPDEMKIICSEAERIYNALGSNYRKLTEKEIKKKNHVRRSIVTKVPVKAGSVITIDKIFFKRPGTGIAPNELKYVLGRRVNRNIKEDELILWDDLLS